MVDNKLTMKDMVGKDTEDVYKHLTNIDNRDQNDLISILAINELLDKKKLKTMSRVKFEQVKVIAKLYMFNTVFGEVFTKQLADLILQLQISTNGIGRKEIVQLVQQRSDIFDLMKDKPRSSKDIFK